MDDSLTPAMRQYYELKSEVADAVLFFRMGDFYEMFAEDAHIAHSVLGVALTTRNKNAKDPIALAGIPYHAKEKYLPKLVQAGYKVAIAEQVSDPKLKGIVKRAIVRIVTPGTLHIESDVQDAQKSNIILAIVKEKEEYALSYIDTSNSDWINASFNDFGALSREVFKIFPQEVILERGVLDEEKLQELFTKKYGLNIYYFDAPKNPKNTLLEHFHVKNLEGYGLENKPLCHKAAALVLEYLKSVQKHDLGYLDSMRYESFSSTLDMDESTIRSLDILYNIFTKSTKEGTLLGVLSHTKTAMGSRLLRDSLVHPLQDKTEIEKRYNIIDALLKDRPLLENISSDLKKIADIDTLLSRLALGRATPRDMITLKKSLRAVLSVVNIIRNSQNKALKELFL